MKVTLQEKIRKQKLRERAIEEMKNEDSFLFSFDEISKEIKVIEKEFQELINKDISLEEVIEELLNGKKSKLVLISNNKKE